MPRSYRKAGSIVLPAQSGQIITRFAFILQDYFFKTSSAFSSTFLPLILAFLIMVLSGLLTNMKEQIASFYRLSVTRFAFL